MSPGSDIALVLQCCGLITLKRFPRYLLHPYQYKSPLVTGHTQDTVTAPSPFCSPVPSLEHGQGPFLTLQWDTGCTHLPVSQLKGNTLPGLTSKASPLFPLGDSAKEGLSGTHPQLTGSLGLSRNIFQGICKPCQSEDYTQPTLLKLFLVKAARTRKMTTLN